MEKPSILFIFEVVLALLLVVVGIWYYFAVFTEDSFTSTVTVEQCELLNDPQDKSFCYYNLALEKKDITLCAKLDNSALNGQMSAGNCYYSLIDEESTNCEYIPYSDLKNACYMIQAVRVKDASVCSKITVSEEVPPESVNDKQVCLSALEGIDACKNLGGRSSVCYLVLVSATRDEATCRSLGIEVHENECYFSLAEINKKAAFCEGIGYKEIKIACYQKLLFTTKDSSLCDKAFKESGEIERTMCEAQISILKAKLTANEKLCGNIPASADCYRYISIIKQDKTICEEIKKIEETENWKEEAIKACYAGE